MSCASSGRQHRRRYDEVHDLRCGWDALSSIAETYGESPSSVEFHGRMVASRKIEPTKNTDIRRTTELSP
jgi:hypothetical protein